MLVDVGDIDGRCEDFRFTKLYYQGMHFTLGVVKSENVLVENFLNLRKYWENLTLINRN